jgi:hypothetical protein
MNQLQTVLDALEMNRVMATDSDGNYTREITPKQITEAIAIVKQMLQAEPVEYQSRRKPDFGSDWTYWENCSEATFKDCLKFPKLHDWTYEARALYARPAQQAVPAEPSCPYCNAPGLLYECVHCSASNYPAAPKGAS